MTPVRELGRVAVRSVAEWALAIDLADWPQQHRVDAQLRPAMVNDPEWHGLARATDVLVAELLQRMPDGARDYNRMLSVVMPGHEIEPHADVQEPSWLTRIHVPLTTNNDAVMRFGREEYHLEVGHAYLIDTRQEHAVKNGGRTPRVHFMFDVRT